MYVPLYIILLGLNTRIHEVQQYLQIFVKAAYRKHREIMQIILTTDVMT